MSRPRAARDIALSMLQSLILVFAEAVQAAKLHHKMSTGQQAILLSAGDPGTGSTCTAMVKSPTELMQNAQWRVATGPRLGMPRTLCETVVGSRCANSHLRRTVPPILLRVPRSEGQTAPSGRVHVE